MAKPKPKTRPNWLELRIIKINTTIAAMRAGAILRLHYGRGGCQHWHLDSAVIDPRVAQGVIDSPEVQALDDALPIPGGALPQTFVIRS